MKKEIFLREIERELGQGSHAERFHEELSDHLDDSLNDPMNTHSQEEATQSLGDPKKLTKQFNGYLTAKSAGRALVHSLMNVLLSVPLYAIAVWGLLMLVDAFWNHIDHPTILIQSAVALLVSAALLFLLFHKSIPDIFLAIPGWRPHLLWLVIMFGPQLLIAWNSPATFEGLDPEGTATVPGYILFSVLASQLGLFLFTTATFVLSVKRARKIRRIKTRRKWRLSTFAPAMILLAYVCISQILVIAQETNSYPAVFNRVPRDLLHSFLFPRGIVEYIVFNILLARIVLFPFGAFLPFWIIGGGLIFLVGIVVWRIINFFRMRHEGSFPWFGCVGLIYVVLLLWTSPIRSADITTIVPTAHMNAHIERQRLGPFYRFARYLNNSEGPFFQYTVFTNGTSFLIRPGRGMTAFSIGNIQSAIVFDIRRVPEETSHMREEDDEYINRREEEFNGVACTYNHDDPAEEEALRKDTLCNTLLYHGQPFFRNNSPWFGWLNGLTLTDDGKWAMIRLSTGAYDAENIYLVDLRSLQ